MKNWVLLICLYFLTSPLLAQVDKIMDANIQTVLIFPKGKPLALPVIGLNSQDELLIQFDDLSANYKQYYYTIELMDMSGSLLPSIHLIIPEDLHKIISGLLLFRLSHNKPIIIIVLHFQRHLVDPLSQAII